MSNEDRLREIELKYMEQFERGEAPTLEELIEYYPDLSEELTEFVLDFIALEKAAERTELSEDEMADAMTVQAQAVEKALKKVSSFKELEREKQRLFNLLEDATFIAIQALNARTECLEVPDSFEVSHDPETGELRLEPREG